VTAVAASLNVLPKSEDPLIGPGGHVIILSRKIPPETVEKIPAVVRD
jgi:hypothetical protein